MIQYFTHFSAYLQEQKVSSKILLNVVE